MNISRSTGIQHVYRVS